MTLTGVSRARQIKGALFHAACLAGVVVACLFLLSLLAIVLKDGLAGLNAKFFANSGSSFANKAGIKSALAGSIWVVSLTILAAVPIGVATAVFLEELAPKRNRWISLVQTNINNLAGVPSIVYGLLGLAVFVRLMDLGRSVLSGGLTMALLVLPLIIVVTQEAIKAVPSSLREGALALGATKWQTIRTQVLPSARGNIVTGVILAVSRAIGETAPLIVVGAVSYIGRIPAGLDSKFTVLPIQIFDWTLHPSEDFKKLAASAILVLLGLLLTLNGIAVYIRTRCVRRHS
ncbi:MAG: phosphate ABC transporter permease PstA [Fimbriimonadaceae bacterium]